MKPMEININKDEKLVAIAEFPCLGVERFAYRYWYMSNHLLSNNEINTSYIKRDSSSCIIDIKRTFQEVKRDTIVAYGRLITNQKELDKHMMMQELLR